MHDFQANTKAMINALLAWMWNGLAAVLVVMGVAVDGAGALGVVAFLPLLLALVSGLAAFSAAEGSEEPRNQRICRLAKISLLASVFFAGVAVAAILLRK